MNVNVRLVDDHGRVREGHVTRISKSLVHVTSHGSLFVCNRSTGKPSGGKGMHSIHPDDLAVVQAEPLSPPRVRQYRSSAGRPGHWSV